MLILNTPQFLLFVAYFLLFAYAIWKTKWFELKYFSRQFLLLAFVLKVFSGVAFTLIYTFYYSDKFNADIYKYFDDGLILQSIFFYSPKLFFRLLFEVNIESAEVVNAIKNFNHWDPKVRSLVYNDSRFIIKLNALFSFISLKNIFIHSLFGSFIGFCGIAAIAKAAERLFNSVRSVGWLLFFFPSIMFWTSALLKETLLIFVFGFFLLHITAIAKKFSFQNLIAVVVFFLLLLVLKVYVLLCLLPPIAGYFFTIKFNRKLPVFMGFVVVSVITVFIGYAIDSSVLNSSVFAGIAQKQHDMQQLANFMQAGSVVYVPQVDVTRLSTFILAGLYGVSNVCFRPFLWDANSIFFAAAAIENIILAVLMLLFIFSISKLSTNDWRMSLMCVFFAFFLFTIIGITTPVLGSVVRYRVPGLLLLLFPLSLGVDFFVQKVFSIQASLKE